MEGPSDSLQARILPAPRGRIQAAAAVFVLLNFPISSFAWGPVAHRAIAKIAESRLSPQARRAIRDILGKDGKNHDVHLDQIAACPDAFSMADERFCAYDFNIEGDPKRTKSWHYINIPISLKAATRDSLKRYCPHGTDCVVAQIRKDMGVLKDPKSSRLAKQEALMYLVHFVGDAHQPLHCADDHDQGGNLKPVNVEYNGQALNLHTVWDDALDDHGKVVYLLPEENLAEEADALASQLEQDLEDPEAHKSGEIETWTQGDDLPGQMALESWGIAKNVIYPQYAKDHGAISNPAHNQIGREYKTRMQPIAYERIEMAGVRLAFLLNQIFPQN